MKTIYGPPAPQEPSIFLGNDGSKAWLEVECGFKGPHAEPYCVTNEKVELNIAYFMATNDEEGVKLHVANRVYWFAKRLGVKKISEGLLELLPEGFSLSTWGTVRFLRTPAHRISEPALQ